MKYGTQNVIIASLASLEDSRRNRSVPLFVNQSDRHNAAYDKNDQSRKHKAGYRFGRFYMLIIIAFFQTIVWLFSLQKRYCLSKVFHQSFGTLAAITAHQTPIAAAGQSCYRFHNNGH